MRRQWEMWNYIPFSYVFTPFLVCSHIPYLLLVVSYILSYPLPLFTVPHLFPQIGFPIHSLVSPIRTYTFHVALFSRTGPSA